jgi:hypothetical protein
MTLRIASALYKRTLAAALFAALVSAVFASVGAAAVPAQRVAQAHVMAGPATAGSGVFFVAAGVSGRSIELRRTVAGRTRTVTRLGAIHRLAEPPAPVVAASDSRVAVGVPAGYSDSGHSQLLVGPPAGPLTPVAPGCPGGDQFGAFGLDGSRLAFVRTDCDGGRHVVVRDLDTGAESGFLPTSGGDVALAGGWVAFRDPQSPADLDVYDLGAGRVAYTVPADGLTSFGLQDDGKLATAQGRVDEECGGLVTWYSPADPGGRIVDRCELGAVAIGADRIVHSRYGLRINDLNGGGLHVLSASVGVVGFGLTGDRLALATPGCTQATESVWTVDLSTDYRLPSAPRCLARLRSPRFVARGKVAITFDCRQTGCHGHVELRRGGLSGTRNVDVPRGHVRTLNVKLEGQAPIPDGHHPLRMHVRFFMYFPAPGRATDAGDHVRTFAARR